MKSKEAQEQATLIQWCEYQGNRFEELKLIFHIPNGGKRNKLEAKNLKLQGVKSGIPDLFLPVARGKYHGLFIEMKVGKNKVTNNQSAWLLKLFEQGYMCRVCYGAEEAIKVIKWYLSQGHDIKWED